MLDLIKAFEKIRMKDLVAAALRWRFPIQLLRVMVSMYSMPRRVVVNGSFSRMVQVYSAVVAASSYGTIAMRLMLMAPLDQLVVRWPLAVPYL